MQSLFFFFGVDHLRIELLYPIPLETWLLFSLNGPNALEVFLKLSPRKYKYNAYTLLALWMFSHIQICNRIGDCICSYRFIVKLTQLSSHYNNRKFKWIGFEMPLLLAEIAYFSWYNKIITDNFSQKSVICIGK